MISCHTADAAPARAGRPPLQRPEERARLFSRTHDAHNMGSWLPLESNPEVLNPFARRLGLPEDWAFCDVFGLDEELLAMVPQPCAALCLLYPSTNISAARRAEFQSSRKEHQPAPPSDLLFIQQHDGFGNACGTIACMHAVANASRAGMFELSDGGVLQGFLDGAGGLDPKTCGSKLAGATELQELSDATAASGETEGAGTDDAQGQHFIAFVHFQGMLYELDGRNFDHTDPQDTALPVCHGATTPGTFLSDAARVIREDFMARDPSSINFNVVALSKVDG